ncbi:CheR family methyltransferase [Microvirga sp. TS319]|uniref:CheR family methyltransferase n=1 Tax=Microvirga sp. TS319 TaxID=3241165 RepID=UPI00351A04D9
MAARTAPSLLADKDFPRLKSLIVERTGHFYYQDKDDLLWERVYRRFQETGARSAAQLIALLEDPEAGPDEWARLEAEITIGETFFFRYAEQFAALRQSILPEIIARKKHDRRLRIWSAGCATGAEPYSLAILVHQLLGDDLPDWHLGIVGTDINTRFLETARQARFGPWALRSLSSEDRAAYFLPVDRQQWQVRPEYRSLVRFEQHNLLSLLDGSSPLQYSEFDLILCRNVLIYFHPDTVNRMVVALRDCLLDEAWMLLGHAEPNPSFASLMEVVNLPGTIAYRRRDGKIPEPEAAVETGPVPHELRRPEPPRMSFRPAHPHVGPDLGPPRAPAPKPRPPTPPAVASPSLLAEVRRKADAGDLVGASAICSRALLAEPLNATLYLYHGLVSQALGRHSEAEEAFRRCLYLDKSFAMAHYHLGLLLLAHGRSAPGRRALANAARITASLPEGYPIPEGDGLTAGELHNLVRIHLDPAPPGRRR